MTPEQKGQIFHALKNRLDMHSEATCDHAQNELKEILVSQSINIQGSALKKLREFSFRMSYEISGLIGGYGSSSSSSYASSSASSAGASLRLSGKRPREEYTVAQLLEKAITLHNDTPGTTKVSRSHVYSLFNL
jgi:hypothetical protein